MGFYHYCLAVLAVFLYRNPSKNLKVIGVTGTSGKSTTCYLLTKLLEGAGYKVGLASTIMFKVGEKEWLNDQKMTMVGRFQLQRLLRDMVKAGCEYAIVETTSEGINQSRHKGIWYDVAVFTNLYPEHIESHGSFENYKAAKLKLFKKLESDPMKTIRGEAVPKVLIANSDDASAEDFLDFDIDNKIRFSKTQTQAFKATMKGLSFVFEGTSFTVPILGAHNLGNILAAVSVGVSQGIDLGVMSHVLETVTGIPGRIERIDEGQDFGVIVDYAFEPVAMAGLYETIKDFKPKRIIHVIGSAGGGRDKSKRSKLGAFVTELADVMIVTNEDPYDEDPESIIDDVVSGAALVPVDDQAEVIRIFDRNEAIHKAMGCAKEGDLVLITGKGSEQGMVVKGGEIIPWDDREIAREALRHATI